MPVSFDQLRLNKSSAAACRTLWHLLSVGTVWRDEVEQHQGADKAGLHLFWVRQGSGSLQSPQGCWSLHPSPRCWLVDLRLPRAYEPDDRTKLVTDGFRFNGPLLDVWLEQLGGAGEIQLEKEVLTRLKLIRRSLQSAASLPTATSEWHVHELITETWGRLMAARNRLPGMISGTAPVVQRVMDAVLARPDHPWQAGEMAEISGTSYSSLRAAFKAARGETLHDFLQQVRLDQARVWLSDPRLSIKQVSARLHFRSETYFTHWFRDLSGHPPGAHRRMLRG